MDCKRSFATEHPGLTLLSTVPCDCNSDEQHNPSLFDIRSQSIIAEKRVPIVLADIQSIVSNCSVAKTAVKTRRPSTRLGSLCLFAQRCSGAPQMPSLLAGCTLVD
jgi:hypothetical protein